MKEASCTQPQEGQADPSVSSGMPARTGEDSDSRRGSDSTKTMGVGITESVVVVTDTAT